MPTAPTFDPNSDDTRSIAQWLETALDGYFKDDIGRWAFRPLEQHIGVRDDVADDLCAIYGSLKASAQVRWRHAIRDVLAFHGRDISKREAVRVLVTFAVLIRSPEVLDVLPGILSGQDDGELLDVAVGAATALASQTDASRECLERIRTSPAFTPDYAGLILVALCHADPDNWLHHVKELAGPMRRLAGLLSPESTALRFYASSILDTISLKRIADVNLNHLLSDSAEETVWLLEAWFQDDDSLLCLRLDDVAFRLVLRTDESISVELEYTQYMAIADALGVGRCQRTAIACEREVGRGTWVAVIASGTLVELTCVDSSMEAMSALLGKYLSGPNIAQCAEALSKHGRIALISDDESLSIAAHDDLRSLQRRRAPNRITDRVLNLRKHRERVPHGLRRLAFGNPVASNAATSALSLVPEPEGDRRRRGQSQASRRVA